MRKDNRRDNTIIRHNEIHELAEKIKKDLGGTYKYVSKTYLYDRISSIKHLSTKRIAYILNHTKHIKVED